MDGPIDICSHKRSGTHLLAASIWKNFELPDLTVRAVVHSGKKFVMGSKMWTTGDRVDIPWGGLWRSHNFFNPPWFKDPKRVLYIIRNPVDTLVSFWRFLDPLCKDDLEVHFGKGRVAFWLKHVRGYTDNCRWVRYEDLVGDKHDEVLDQIAEWFDLTARVDTYQRVVGRVGWYSSESPVKSKRPTKTILRMIEKNFPDEFLGYSVDGG